ncbi:MAG TPA: glutamate-cysteine ligase family protein, partial [Patescibacteria group bacterium]|nr:glutamate-cysteine ligase family protein [Patescibacteria group bacterium]
MKIGLEFEFPLVRQDGSAATYDDNIKLWEEWKKLGYTIKKDPYTQKIIGGYKKTPEGILEVGTDYPTCTFEVGLPPEKNLIAANKAWEKFLRKECLPTLDKYNLKLLGYGTQPVTRHLKKYMSPKGHYAIWNKLLPVKYNHWIRDKAIGFAGSQYNIDVPVEKIAEVSNTITKLTCIVWGLSANDPISNSEITPFFSTRIMLYDRIARGHFFGRRTNFFTSDIKNLEDYITRAWKGRIFEIIRNGQPHYPAKSAFSTWDFIKANKATFIDLDGNKK